MPALLRPLLLCCLMAACSRPPQATALEVHGTVSQGGKPVAAGAQLDTSQDLVIGAGQAEIMLVGAGTVRCFANTRLSLSRQNETLRLRLLIGKVWAKVASLPRGKRFEINTQNAVAGVRGTAYVVETDGRGTDVRVRSGTVWVAQKKQPDMLREVHQGERCSVRGDAPPSAATQYSPGSDDRAWEDLADIWRDAGRNLKRGLREIFGPP